MHRRSVLRLVALGVAGLAGCASADDERGPPPTRPPTVTPSPTPSPTPDPTIPTPTPSPYVEELRSNIGEATVSESDGGLVEASVPVENTADRTFDAELVVTVEADQRYTTRKRISVPPETTETVTVTFDVYWADVTDDGEPLLRKILLLKPGTSR